MRTAFLFFITLLILLTQQVAVAQTTDAQTEDTIIYTGTITYSKMNEGLYGCRIYLKDARNINTMTDLNGNFTLNITPYTGSLDSATLMIEAIGYKIREVMLKDYPGRVIRVQMDAITELPIALVIERRMPIEARCCICAMEPYYGNEYRTILIKTEPPPHKMLEMPISMDVPFEFQSGQMDALRQLYETTGKPAGRKRLRK